MRHIVFALCLAGPAVADTQVQTLRYTCERGVEVPVAYVRADDTSLAVLTVEGSQILLYAEPAASGARYGWPSDGSNYVWLTKDNTAMLLWKDAEAGSETTLLASCTAE